MTLNYTDVQVFPGITGDAMNSLWYYGQGAIGGEPSLIYGPFGSYAAAVASAKKRDCHDWDSRHPEVGVRVVVRDSRIPWPVTDPTADTDETPWTLVEYNEYVRTFGGTS